MPPIRIPSLTGGRGRVGGITHPAPSNYGRTTAYQSAQAQLDHTMQQANRQYVEAINMDGIDFHHWRRCTEGRFCTCHKGLSASSPAFDSPSTDPFTKETDGNDPPTSFRVRGGRELREKVAPPPTTPNSLFDFEVKPSVIDGNDKQTDAFESEDEKLLAQHGLLSMGADAGILYGGETTQCGICFGTGYTNGYSLSMGKRDVLDASTKAFVLHNAMCNTEARPQSFEMAQDQTAYVEWVYTLPTYFESAAAIFLRDNTLPAAGLQILYRIDGTADEFAPLTTAFLNSRKGTATRLQLRVQPINAALEGTLSFTHIEFVWQFNPWLKLQMPALGETTNFGVFDNLLTTQFTLPPSLLALGKEDIIYERKYRHMWKLTDVTDFQTAKRQVAGWSANGRQVQDFEQLMLLRLMIDPHYALSYTALADANRFLAADDDF